VNSPATRHGLWLFHRLARQLRERGERGDWWSNDWPNTYSSLRIWNSVRDTWQHPKADLVTECARRYALMFKNIRTVGDWNALCWRIGQRMGGLHHKTYNAVMFSGEYMDRTVIRFRRFAGSAVHYPYAPAKRDILRRVESLRQNAEARRLSACLVCGKTAGKYFVYHFEAGALGLDQFLKSQGNGKHSLCFSHYMAFSKLQARARLVAEHKSAINRTKRKLNEAAKELRTTE